MILYNLPETSICICLCVCWIHTCIWRECVL